MTSLPHGLADPLHIDEPFPLWTLVAGALVLWLLYRMVRSLRERLTVRPASVPVAIPTEKPPEDGGIASVIEAIRRRYRRHEAYRHGCHELASALREHFDRSAEKPTTSDSLTTLTAAEMARNLGDSAVARLFGLLAQLQFYRRAPTRSDFDGACDLALEVAENPARFWRGRS